jgi:hypothetical protein
MRSTFLFFSIITIALSGSCRTTAQSAFSASGEVRVSEAQTGKSRPMITVRGDGICWVLWANASQFLLPDLSFDGTNSSAVKGGYGPASFPNGGWGCIQSIGCGIGTWPVSQGWIDAFHLFVYNTNRIDTSSQLFYIEHFENVNQGADYRGFFNSFRSMDNIEYYFYCYNLNWIDYGIPTGHNRTDNVVGRIEKATNKNISLAEGTLYRMMYQGIDNQMNEFMISPIKNNTFTLMRRLSVGVAEENGLKLPYHRYLDLFSTQGDTLSQNGYVDALAQTQADFAERIVLGNDSDAYLFRRHNHGDSIFVLQAALDGTIRMPDKFVMRGIAGDSLYAEYEVGHLSNNRYFVVWTGIDPQKDTNVFIALLNRDMDIIAGPTRINSDPAGQQCRPFVRTKGDSIYVTWLDTRSGAMHVYLRLITLDQITGTDTQDQPSDFGISGIHPNPVAASAQIQFTVGMTSGNSASLVLYDVFGREVKRILSEQLPPGKHTAQFIRDGLPSGMYSLVLQNGGRMQRKAVVVVR